MRLDFRKTALVIGVTVVLQQIYGIYITITSNPIFPLQLVVEFVIGLLLFIPFPVLFFLLYKTDTIPAVTGKLRALAITIALIYSTIFIANNLYSIFHIYYRGFLRYAILSLFPETVYIVFLAVLSRQDQGKPTADERQARLVRNASLVTLLAVCGKVAMNLVHITTSTVRHEKMLAAYHLAWGPDCLTYHLRNAGDILSSFCSAIAVWVLYKGLSIANSAFLKSCD
jgi:hypothetical protein